MPNLAYLCRDGNTDTYAMELKWERVKKYIGPFSPTTTGLQLLKCLLHPPTE